MDQELRSLGRAPRMPQMGYISSGSQLAIMAFQALMTGQLGVPGWRQYMDGRLRRGKQQEYNVMLETMDDWCHIWVVPTMGVPQNGWFIMEHAIKMDDLWVPL